MYAYVYYVLQLETDSLGATEDQLFSNIARQGTGNAFSTWSVVAHNRRTIKTNNATKCMQVTISQHGHTHPKPITPQNTSI